MDGIIAEPGRSEKQAEESWKGSWTYTSIFLLLDTAIRAARTSCQKFSPEWHRESRQYQLIRQDAQNGHLRSVKMLTVLERDAIENFSHHPLRFTFHVSRY